MSGMPSFILFVTDQHRVDYFGCYGHPVVRTPHIDRIAAAGSVFERCYVNSPVCMPNRASLMTGRVPAAHGVIHNGIPLSTGSVTFVDLLRAAGVRTALVGKSHLQNFTGKARLMPEPGSPAGPGRQPPADLAQAERDWRSGPAYDNESPARWSDVEARVDTPFYGFDHVELVTNHGDEVGGDYRRWLRERRPDAEASLMGEANGLAHDYVCPQAVRTAMPPQLYSSAYIGERAAAWLADCPADAPFFLMVSFPDPHHPFNPPGHYWDMYRPEQFERPAAFVDAGWQAPPHVRAMITAREAGKAVTGGQAGFACSEREALEARALTAGMITCIDDAIGQVMAALSASGRADETVVMLTADHGDYLGDHRLLLKGVPQYDTITHVPLIVADPQRTDQAARVSALAQTIDIPATILDRAGLAPYHGLQGLSLLPTLDGTTRVRDDALVQFDGQRLVPGTNRQQRAHTLVHDQWRMSLYDGVAWGELYDLRADPGELVNLWDSAAHAQVRAMMTERMLRAEIAAVQRVPLATSLA
ncbi:MAG: sulfatase-like hydrolase/transferase [Burkholderiaceae bacterium]